MPNLGILSGSNVIICTLLATALVFFIGCSSSSPDEASAPADSVATSAPVTQDSSVATAVPAPAESTQGEAVGLRDGHFDGLRLGHPGF